MQYVFMQGLNCLKMTGHHATIIFNPLLIQMYAKITKPLQREDHETREILELFYKKYCRT